MFLEYQYIPISYHIFDNAHANFSCFFLPQSNVSDIVKTDY